MKPRDHMIPISSRRNSTETVQSVYGEIIPTKRCGCCSMNQQEGLEFYPTRDHEADYKDCCLCYDLKKKFNEEWKRSKKVITKVLRQNHILNFKERKEVFEYIFRNEGQDNYFEKAF